MPAKGIFHASLSTITERTGGRQRFPVSFTDNRLQPTLEKDRENTRRRIYNAMVELLTEGGFKALGVNAVARRAGVGKSLIYRYFGGMEGLLLSYAKDGDFWPVLEDALLEHMHSQKKNGRLSDLATMIWVEAARELRVRRNTQEILRWELVEDNDLAKRVSEYRLRQTTHMIKFFDGVDGIDVPAITALLSGGMIYAVLLAKHHRQLLGIDLHDDTGWTRLENAARSIYESLYRQHDPDYREPSPDDAPLAFPSTAPAANSNTPA